MLIFAYRPTIRVLGEALRVQMPKIPKLQATQPHKPWLLLEAQQGLIVESCCFVLTNPAGHSNCLDETLNPEPAGHKCSMSGDRNFKPQTSSQEPLRLEAPIPHHAMRFSRVLLAYFFQDLVQKMVWARDFEQGFLLGCMGPVGPGTAPRDDVSQ